MIVSIISFIALVFLTGVLLVNFAVRDKNISLTMVLTQGPVALTGLCMLFYYAFGEVPGIIPSYIIFIFTFIIGAIVILRDYLGKPLPRWTTAVQGFLAITGFVLLIAYAFFDLH